MILEVSSELAGGDAEKVLDEVACKANALVGVMVLVVWFLVIKCHFENLSDDSSEEDSFLLSVFSLVTKVRKEFSVEELVYSCFTVFLLLSSGEFLLQPFVGFVSTLYVVIAFLLFITVNFVDVCYDVLECLLRTRDSSEYFLVCLLYTSPSPRDS